MQVFQGGTEGCHALQVPAVVRAGNGALLAFAGGRENGSRVAFLDAADAAPLPPGIRPSDLRCEYRRNPLGIDVARPRLSWTLASGRRGDQQTGRQILVSSSAERLARDEGDLWDSGKVAFDQTLQVGYAGQPLPSRMRVWWKVRVWDRRDQASAWSEPGTWTMGLLHRSDWRARWIADADSATNVIAPGPLNGYHSEFANSADTTKWVAIDLGEPQSFDAVRLFPARPYDWQPDTPGFLFPGALQHRGGLTVRFLRCAGAR